MEGKTDIWGKGLKRDSSEKLLTGGATRHCAFCVTKVVSVVQPRDSQTEAWSGCVSSLVLGRLTYRDAKAHAISQDYGQEDPYRCRDSDDQARGREVALCQPPVVVFPSGEDMGQILS